MWRVTLRGIAARKLRLSLTILAIVLGVTFVTGTLVLGDTLNRTFNTLIGTAYQHVSFEIRGKATLSGADTAVNSTAYRKPVPASLAAQLGRVPGVAYVHGSVGGYAQFLARNGDAIGGGGGSTLGFSFDPNRELSPYRLVQGRAPVTANDVVMDKATATKYHYAVGDRVLMNLPDRPQTFTVTGIVTYGSDDNLAGVTLAGFDLATAQRLFHVHGSYDTISVLAAPSANTVKLELGIARILPPGVQVVSGQTVANELSNAVDNELSFISTALLIFAAIALFVGGFTIFNTLSITVGQRTRELALLRLVGAGRRQVFRSVLSEAALTGLVASLIGLGLGVGAALGLKALLNAFGITLPSAPLVFEARTPIVAVAVGVVVTMISAIVPARRAVRVAPVAALSDHSADQSGTLARRRVILGAAVAIIGVAAVAAGLAAPAVGLVGLGAVCVFAAAAALVPIAARPLSGALGRPLASALGMPGRLGRENSMRNPRRTAQTAAALMIGLALVSTIAVLGASLSSSAANQVDSAVNADYIITGSGGFSRSVVPAVSHLPGVTTVTAVYRGQFEFRGALSSLAAASSTRLSQTVNLHITSGRGASAMAAGELLVDANTARADDLTVGSTAPVRFAQTGAMTMRIGGVFASNPLVGSFIVGDGFFGSHFDNPLPSGVLLRTAPGTPSLNQALNRVLVPYANVSSKTRAQFESDQKHAINQELGLVYVLLALAIVVALIGIVNTLMLSVFERTREIGLLRAVGMKRRQVRAMIRSESVIVALFGAVIGILIGTGLGVALAGSLRNSGVTTLSVPIASLTGFLVLSALLGLAAGTWPARRAARLDVLAAIATE
jgi:putative ABC transport system permease protein